jgi:hypothetical protein
MRIGAAVFALVVISGLAFVTLRPCYCLWCETARVMEELRAQDLGGDIRL